MKEQVEIAKGREENQNNNEYLRSASNFACDKQNF